MTKFTEALDTYMNRRDKRNKLTARATVVSVANSIAIVIVNGSSKSQPALIPDNLLIGVGDQCTLESNQSNQTVRWVVNTVIHKTAYSGANGSSQQFTQLYQPPNFRVIPSIVANAVTLSWDAPAELPVVFEIETSNSDEATEGTKVLQTRGSYAIIPTETDIYVRIRSVYSTGATSSWSDWLLASPFVTTAAAQTTISSFNQATSSPTTLLVPSAGSYLLEIRVAVTVAASAGSPTISIGTSGTPNLYLLTTETNLKISNEYIIPMIVSLGGSPSNIILTITPSAQTFSGIISITYKV